MNDKVVNLVEPAGKILESGKSLAGNRFIRVLKSDEKEIKLDLLSGRYFFEIRK